MKKANPIAKALGPKGSMHKKLGVNPKSKIPKAKLMAAAKGKGAMAKSAALLIKLEGRPRKKK